MEINLRYLQDLLKVINNGCLTFATKSQHMH